jgi:hypothetical protein
MSSGGAVSSGDRKVAVASARRDVERRGRFERRPEGRRGLGPGAEQGKVLHDDDH